MAKAMVVLCPHRPDALAGQPMLGHAAWGFEYPDGSWCIGALEGPGWQGSYNGFWALRVPNLRAALMYFAETGSKRGNEYDVYKLLTVSDGITPDWKAADNVVAWAKHQPYNLTGGNCMNRTYDVLRAFANCAYNGSELPSPHLNWIPNGWFNAIQTPEYYKLPTVMHAHARSPAPTATDMPLADNPATPAWRVGEVLPDASAKPDWKAVDFIAPTQAAPVQAETIE